CASEKPAPSMRANAVELTMRVFMVGSPRKAGRVDRQGHADGDLVRRAIHTGWATSLRGEQLRGLNSGSAFTKRMDVHAFFLAETPEGPWECAVAYIQLRMGTCIVWPPSCRCSICMLGDPAAPTPGCRHARHSRFARLATKLGMISSDPLQLAYKACKAIKGFGAHTTVFIDPGNTVYAQPAAYANGHP